MPARALMQILALPHHTLEIIERKFPFLQR
jgi:hypothetical protein